jgi:hypothetical protein
MQCHVLICAPNNPDSFEHNQLASPLLRLPAELRNKIYDLLVFEDNYRLACRPRADGERFIRVMGISHPRALAKTCRQLHIEYPRFIITIEDLASHELKPYMLGKPAQSPITTLRLKFFEHRALYGKSLERGQLATVKALPKLESLWLMVMTRFDEANIAENWDMIEYHCGYPIMNDRRAWEKKVRMQVYYVRPDITVKFEYLWK